MAKMSLTFIMTAFKAENFQKTKWSIHSKDPKSDNHPIENDQKGCHGSHMCFCVLDIKACIMKDVDE